MRFVIALSLLALVILGVYAVPAAAQERITVRPADTGEVLVNPGMGWVLYYYDNGLEKYGAKLAPSDTVEDFPGLSVAYFRLPWALIEPREGRFDWSILDIPAQRWILKGKRVAFRFSYTGPGAAPRWHERAGAKGHIARVGTGEGWEPDLNDPVFLDRLDRFLAAAAARYERNPDVAFIDMGASKTERAHPPETVFRHIDLYRKHFQTTLLAATGDFLHQDTGPICWSGTKSCPPGVEAKAMSEFSRAATAVRYATNEGLTYRVDGMPVQSGPGAYPFQSDMWDFHQVPTIIETEPYDAARARGAWGDGSPLLGAVEAYHASYASIRWYPREFFKENAPLVERINRRLGYRLQLTEVSWPAEVSTSGEFRAGYEWRNAGVAMCLPGGYPALTLKDSAGGIVAVWVDRDFDVRLLPVGAAGKAPAVAHAASFRFPPFVAPGNYDIYVSVGTRTGTPKIALPLAGDDGQHRYKLGTVRVA